ncbi:hypothetical protein PVAG01_10520 [Phlyctema vagabunda]|uniref:Uncharacterized protein n=1 Tax=Phlyctema vagabunda TaxID=108571 RepID=A0ABR4P2I2_9HELO
MGGHHRKPSRKHTAPRLSTATAVPYYYQYGYGYAPPAALGKHSSYLYDYDPYAVNYVKPIHYEDIALARTGAHYQHAQLPYRSEVPYYAYPHHHSHKHAQPKTHARRRHHHRDEEYQYPTAVVKERHLSYSRPLPQESLSRCCGNSHHGHSHYMHGALDAEYDDIFPEPYALAHEPEARFGVKPAKPLYTMTTKAAGTGTSARYENPFRPRHSTSSRDHQAHHHAHRHSHQGQHGHQHSPDHRYYYHDREEKESFFPFLRPKSTKRHQHHHHSNLSSAALHVPVSMPKQRRYAHPAFPEPYAVPYAYRRDKNPFRVKYPLPRAHKVVYDQESVEEYPRFTTYDSDATSSLDEYEDVLDEAEDQKEQYDDEDEDNSVDFQVAFEYRPRRRWR